MKDLVLNCILLVDDDEPTNFLNEMLLKRMGVKSHIQVIDSAQDALDYLMERGEFSGDEPPQPGIIFLDINMPEMNGWEFIEEYQKLEESKKSNIVICMLTTSSNPDDKKLAETHQEIAEFRTKPLTKEIVAEIAEKYFGVTV